MALIRSIKETYGESIEMIALGTNAIAASMMLKVGANRAASGENAIVQTVKHVDVIIGAISISWANAALGEVTPRMAEAIMSSPAPKLFIPLSQEPVAIIGVTAQPLPHLVKQLVNEKLKEVLHDV